MRITRSLYAIIATILIAAVPVAAPAQFAIGIGFTVGFPPPPMPYYAQPVVPYPGYMWTPGYWAWGPAGYYWVPGTWVAPPAVGMLWTPGYWGYTGGGYGWNPGYWGPTVGFYGGVNYGYGYPGTGFYGGAWNGGNYAYNTAVTNVNTTVIHNTYNRTVINERVCNNCKTVSYNGGKGGTTARATQTQINARKNGRAPTSAQKQQATVAREDRNQLASVNKGKPTVGASQKPFSTTHKPSNFAPLTAKDKQHAEAAYTQGKTAQHQREHTAANQAQHQKQQQQMHAGNQQQMHAGNQQQMHAGKQQQMHAGQQQQMHAGQQQQMHAGQQQQMHAGQQQQMHAGQQQQMQGRPPQQSQPHHYRQGGGTPPQGGTQGNPGHGNPNGGGGKQQGNKPPNGGNGRPPLR